MRGSSPYERADSRSKGSPSSAARNGGIRRTTARPASRSTPARRNWRAHDPVNTKRGLPRRLHDLVDDRQEHRDALDLVDQEIGARRQGRCHFPESFRTHGEAALFIRR